MKRVEFDRYGDAAAMRMGDCEVPPPKAGQVRVRVKAAAINPLDWKQLRGMLMRRYKVVFATMGIKHLADIAEFAAQGKLRSTIGRERPFSEAVDTIVAAESGARVPGRVVLIF